MNALAKYINPPAPAADILSAIGIAIRTKKGAAIEIDDASITWDEVEPGIQAYVVSHRSGDTAFCCFQEAAEHALKLAGVLS